jgi:hypothetical protein
MAFFCVMSFCEVENKQECMRTVQLFINAKLKENYRPAGLYFIPEVIYIISYLRQKLNRGTEINLRSGATHFRSYALPHPSLLCAAVISTLKQTTIVIFQSVSLFAISNHS